MHMPVGLAPEWQRLDLLSACVSAQRRGQPIGDELRDRLQDLQAQVARVRRSAPWEALIARHGLEPMDQDILACAAGPDAEPRLGWAFQELQPGVTSPYPTPALVRELLFVEDHQAPAFLARLDDQAPLRRQGLLERAGELYQPLRTTAQARNHLLGWPAPRAVAPPGAVEVEVRAGWSDLVLPPSCRAAINELLARVQQRPRVEGEWGARPGGGPIALFSGPSGTGKTFAAQVVAGALGYRLFRADLGLLVSKYVGETEKNLNGLLDAVDDQPVVLLFDEADSLFGRRADVKDARDRYANMEISHLLTRIEQHRGPCILTTNLRQHLDAAFLRRFHLVVDFPRPDAASRAALWALHLPPRAPRRDDVDLDLLGQAVALSGAQIRNAALRAAYLASAAGEPLGLSHLARAVWMELAKEGRELNPAMLGALAPFLPEVGP